MLKSPEFIGAFLYDKYYVPDFLNIFYICYLHLNRKVSNHMGVEKDIIDGKTNETSWQKIVGVIVTCTGIIGMLVMIPQAISVWSGSAEGVSFFYLVVHAD